MSTDSNEVDVISYSATCDEVETIPYSLVCEALDQCLNGSKIPEDLKQEVQDISCAVQSIVEEKDKQEIDKIVSVVDAVSNLGKVTPEKMKEEQQKDLILELVYKQVTAGEKPNHICYCQSEIQSCEKISPSVQSADFKKGVLH